MCGEGGCWCGRRTGVTTVQSEIYSLVVAMKERLPCCQDVQGERIVLDFVENWKPPASKVLSSDASAG